MTAKFYEGNAVAEARIRLLMPQPQTSLKLTLTNIDAKPLLQDLGAGTDRIGVSGKGNLSMLVSMAGRSPSEMTRQLNGTMRFSFADGR